MITFSMLIVILSMNRLFHTEQDRDYELYNNYEEAIVDRSMRKEIFK